MGMFNPSNSGAVAAAASAADAVEKTVQNVTAAQAAQTAAQQSATQTAADVVTTGQNVVTTQQAVTDATAAKNDAVTAADSVAGLGNAYATMDLAQTAITTGTIPNNGLFSVISTDNSQTYAIWENVSGTPTAVLDSTGAQKTYPSGAAIEAINALINAETNENTAIILDVNSNPLSVSDNDGNIYIPGIDGSLQDRVNLTNKNFAPHILRLTDAENAAYGSVDEFGDLRLPGLPDSIQNMMTIMKSQIDSLRKSGLILNAKDCGLKENDDAHRALQRGYDWLNANGGGTLFIPEGNYKCYFPTTPKSNVSLVGAGRGSTVLLPMSYQAPIYYRGNGTYIQNLLFSNFTIDGENQQIHPTRNYIPDIKGIFMQYYQNCVIDNIAIINTGATGLGVDMPNNVSITRCLVQNCGRLAVVGDAGASGIGLGTSNLDSEPIFVSKNVCNGNTNYGIFFEPQLSNGIAQDAIVTDNICTGNYGGIGDCGIEGLIAINNNLRANKYGFKASVGTNGGGKPGSYGILKNNIIKENTSHGIYFNTTNSDVLEGAYSLDGNHICNNGEDGINIKLNHENQNHSISGNHIYLNGRHGIHFEGGDAINVDITNNKIYNNGQSVSGNGIQSDVAISKSSIANNKIRDTQDTVTQQYPISISGDLTDVDISFNHCAGNAQNSLNLTGTQTNVTTNLNAGI
ncbi:right-handed parallel beta-helix repeat-containing protein [Martelella alba]|uniref:Right-handed parallel beta-helix repeat-containing protein n=1 Tax=Martelella alba TaxID=2590451 RepID=A0ABY2SQS5_9HYPH|nr:NosD domain-containing protein [Martelella alba]TKI08331.1 right-handed parallel beta-helix repeat-containing protein [Martelella alba]